MREFRNRFERLEIEGSTQFLVKRQFHQKIISLNYYKLGVIALIFIETEANFIILMIIEFPNKRN